jgi:pilus assembly protein CpaF
MRPEPDLSGGGIDSIAGHLHTDLLGGCWGSGVDGTSRDELRALTRSRAPLLGAGMVERVVDEVGRRVSGLGPLEPWLTDPDISEVMVNGGGAVWIEREGRLSMTSLVLDESVVLALIERIVAPIGLHIDRASPIVDARLVDGSRVNAIIRPLAVDGPCLTIRRFGTRSVRLDDICPPDVAGLLRWIIRSRANVIVCGGAGAGKTTLLNAMAAIIGDDERVITIEDAAELRLPGAHVVRLEARPPNAEGSGEVRIRDLVRNALRMRPDRIVVGEVRAGEAIDMLQAMNTGQEGSLSTCHANSSVDALRRLETLVLMGDVALPSAAIREQIRAAIDFVVHVVRRPDGTRGVAAIAEVVAGGDGHEAVAIRDLLDDSGRVTALPSRRARNHAVGLP